MAKVYQMVDTNYIEPLRIKSNLLIKVTALLEYLSHILHESYKSTPGMRILKRRIPGCINPWQLSVTSYIATLFNVKIMIVP